MAERKIGGNTIRVQPLAARDAIALYADLLRVVGNASGRIPAMLVGLMSEDEGDNYLADVAAIGAVSDILNAAATPDIVDLLSRIVAVAEIMQPSKTYRSMDLDGDFTGHLGDLLPIIRFVMEEQFRDFFSASAGNGILRLLREAFGQKR